MKFQLETEFPDVLVELNCGGRYEVSFGDFAGDDESWTPILAEFFYKSDALKWAFDVFKNIKDEEKFFVVLDRDKDPTQEMETFDIDEMEYIKDLIQEEIDNGN
jgi:hypothetical protein